jgi:hypothetical protein
MAAAQPGEGRWIIGGRIFGIVVVCGEQMPRHHGSTCGDGHAIEEVTAGDAAFHSQIAVAYVAQRASESPKCSDWNIQLKCSNWNILYVQRESKINCKKRRISGLPTAGVSITHFLKSVNQAFPQTSTAWGG